MKVEQLSPGVVCVEVEGEFDLWRAYEFDHEMRRLEDDGVETVVIDPRGLTFVDSAGLARLIAANRRASKDGRRLSIVRGCRAMERLFALAALDSRFDMVSAPESVLSR